MSTALAPAKSLTLFECVEEVNILLDCEETVTPSQQDEYRRDLAAAMTRQTTKIDRVNGFIKHCQANAKAAGEEIKRLQGRKKTFENAEDAMRDAVRFTLQSIAQPDKAGKMCASLKSPLVTFSLRGNPPKVEIRDEAQIPRQFKSITLTLPVEDFDILLIHIGPAATKLIQLHIDQAFIGVDPKAVQVAIETAVAEAEALGAPTKEELAVAIAEARASVPGAYLPEEGTNSVVIR